MRVLFTADWQSEWSNLDQCEPAWKFCVESCVKRKVNLIGVLGDMKQQYNPVDVRVTKFWLWAVSYAQAKGIQVFFILGNHDRVGQYTDAQNWLPILRRSGAHAYDTPTVFPTMDGSRIFVLPFMSSTTLLRQEAKKLLERKPDKEKDILVFHGNLAGCRFNQLGQKSEGGFRAQDLFPSRYRYCIGGDIHLPQKIGENIYYTGSPFPMDWGECNQSKRMVLVTSKGIEFLPSPASRWHDTSWPGFDPKRVTDGDKVRIHVRCSTAHYGRDLVRARKAAERSYPGATIITVPEFRDRQDRDIKIKATDSDKKKIQAFVHESLPLELKVEEQRIVSYLAYQLSKVGGVIRSETGLIFQKARGVNVLSFKEFEFDYRNRGIIVVEGKNEDWQGRSNGSGKTNFQQLIPIALQGTTFKGQKFDKWARRFTDKQASAELWFKDQQGRKIKTERTRRPGSLRLYINGVDESSGLRSNGKEATQGMIEQVSGFTWQTLANAVYIDQEVTNAFLAGTKKERTQLLSKFQNLERFEAAQLLVRKQKVGIRNALLKAKETLSVTKARIKDAKDTLKETRRVIAAESKRAKKQWYEAIEKHEAAQKKLTAYINSVADKKVQYDHRFEYWNKQADKFQKKCQAYKLRIEQLEHWISDSRDLQGGKCPTCKQPVCINKKKLKAWQTDLKYLRGWLPKTEQLYKQANSKAWEYDAKLDTIKIKVGNQETHVKILVSQTEHLGSVYKAQKEGTEGAKETIEKYTLRFRKLKAQRKSLFKYIVELEKSTTRLDYCDEALGRDGIPAFLNRQLAPLLNKAAKYYAKLFGDMYIQVRFEVIDGEFEPRIINASGGEELIDQSVGERALAGLITSFALREMAPACNLLILDEPGGGLDPVNARNFARALPKLKERFSTILLTTHNQEILSELSGENKVTIVKSNRVSRMM